MGRALLITGTDTGVGKTFIGCSLAYAANARAMRVGVMKPAETGCRELRGTLEPADARALALAAATRLALELICPYRYRAPLAPAAAAEAEGAAAPDPEVIARAFGQIAAESDIVIVEGAGGLAVPLRWDFDYADLARALDLEVVLVVGNRLGCLNAARLSLWYAASRGLRLAGYVLNDIEAEETPASATNEASMRRLTDAACLGRVRFREPIRREIIEALLGV